MTGQGGQTTALPFIPWDEEPRKGPLKPHRGESLDLTVGRRWGGGTSSTSSTSNTSGSNSKNCC